MRRIHLNLAGPLVLFLLLLAPAATGTALLIPESTNDTVGLYSEFNGMYLGDLINDPTNLATPINAVQGPDGRIYVSDQINDSVVVYNSNGVYQQTIAPGTDTLDNVRGITFNGNELLVTVGGGANADAIARFNLAGTYLGNLNTPNTLEFDSPFDIEAAGNGTFLVSGIDTDNIANISGLGAFLDDILDASDGLSFPEQIKATESGNYLLADFSANLVIEFDLGGNILNSFAVNGARGVHPLGNGNILVTNDSGVFEYATNGTLINTIRTGISARFIEASNLSEVPEPGTWAMLAGGLVAIISLRRRQQARR